MATISHRYSLPGRVFLLSAYRGYSAKYELMFNDYQEQFPNSPIPIVYHIFKHFEKWNRLKIVSVLVIGLHQRKHAFVSIFRNGVWLMQIRMADSLIMSLKIVWFCCPVLVIFVFFVLSYNFSDMFSAVFIVYANRLHELCHPWYVDINLYRYTSLLICYIDILTDI